MTRCKKDYSSPELFELEVSAEAGFADSGPFRIDKWEDGTIIEDEC